MPENYTVQDVPADMLDDLAAYRDELIETVVDQDDDLMMAYMEVKYLLWKILSAAFAKEPLNWTFPDLLWFGVQEQGDPVGIGWGCGLLAQSHRGYSPALTDEEGKETGEVAVVSVDEPFRALAFKIMDDRFGALTFIRIYSGKLQKGDTILNSFTGKTERIGRMVEMHANDPK